MDSEQEDFVVVIFEDEGTTAIVPSKQVIWTGQPKEGEVVSVTWSNKKQYAATYIMKGDIKCYSLCGCVHACVCEYLYPFHTS